MIPIPRTVADPSYRYKMPLLETRFEGKGVGVKTNLINLPSISKSLQVPVDYVLKFLSYDLGLQTHTKKQNGVIVSEFNIRLTLL